MPRATTAAWGGHAAADGEGCPVADIMPSMSPGEVSRRTRTTFFAPVSPGLGVLSGEDDAAAGGSGRRGQRAANGLRGLQRLASNWGWSRVSSVLGSIMATACFSSIMPSSTRSQAIFQSGRGGTLAVTGLEHIQLAGFHGELHVLHVVVVAFQNLADLGELGETPRGTSPPFRRWA